MEQSFQLGILRFQPTLPRRERQNVQINDAAKNVISTHTPTKGATLSVISLTSTYSFQPTLPRRERRLVFTTIFMYSRISTHTPTKGATLSCLQTLQLDKFQPTLPRRERLDIKSLVLVCL